MRIVENIRGPLLFGALWLLAAQTTIFLRDSLDAVLLIWLPSAISVATLHLARLERWPIYIAALLIAQTFNGALIGLSPVNTVVFAFAASVEAITATRLGSMALGRHKIPESLWHFVGIFMAAVVGASLSAVITAPFRAPGEPLEMAWWFLASVLGIQAGTPVLMLLRERVGQNVDRLLKLDNGKLLAMELTALAIMAIVVLSIDVPLTPLLVIGVVFITIRHGQLGSSLGVIACVLAATAISIGGDSPAHFMDLDPFTAGLWLQGLMFLILAVSLPLAALLMAQAKLQDRLRKRASQLSDNLAIVRLAEDLAGIGRWHLDLRSGRQHWSPRMLEMNGLDPAGGPDPGDITAMLPDGGRMLFGEIAGHECDREPYRFDNRIKPPGQPERFLRMSVQNQFDASGERVGIFGVAMDVTEQVRREEALDLARGRAMRLADEARAMANTDALTGLPNRRHALQRLEGMVAEAEREGRGLSAIMFDIDFFKRINDSFGHQTGDDVLRRVAWLAQKQTRAHDLVGRLGGEEFTWLMPSVTQREAGALAERLRKAVEDGSSRGGLPPVTISMGCAQWQHGDSGEVLLAKADAALYAAKEGGRNRVRKAA